MASLTDLFGRIMNTPILCAGSNDISIEKNENLSLEGREGGGGQRRWPSPKHSDFFF